MGFHGGSPKGIKRRAKPYQEFGNGVSRGIPEGDQASCEALAGFGKSV